MISNDLRDVLEQICNNKKLLDLLDEGDWPQLYWSLDGDSKSWQWYDIMKYLKEECGINYSKYFNEVIFGEDFHDTMFIDNISVDILWDVKNSKVIPDKGTFGLRLFSTSEESLIELGSDEEDIVALEEFIDDHDVLFRIKPEFVEGLDDVFIIISEDGK